MVYFKDMDEEHIMWENQAKKFSKREILELYKHEKKRVKLFKEIIRAHKVLMKQAAQRLELSKHMEV